MSESLASIITDMARMAHLPLHRRDTRVSEGGLHTRGGGTWCLPALRDFSIPEGKKTHTNFLLFWRVLSQTHISRMSWCSVLGAVIKA